jgi:hypothetical protein
MGYSTKAYDDEILARGELLEELGRMDPYKWDEYNVVEENGSPDYCYKATLKSKGVPE